MINFNKTKSVLTLMIGLAPWLTSWAQVKRDSLDIKIGQMIMVGAPSTYADSVTLHSIHQGQIGAVLLFEKNISPDNSSADLKRMVSQYKNAASIPLFVAIDQEGGRVNRLKEKYGFPRSITAEAMGKSIDSVRFYGHTTAATLAGLGININLAPVVDMAVNPNNPVIAKLGRAFSASGKEVARDAKAFIREHRKQGVITALKHFPGHGSSTSDTHLGLADVTASWTTKELEPYKILLREGYVDAVMTAHIVNKKLDKTGKPGTLSKPILDSLLRQVIGYHGVVISDDMQMHAITKYFGFEEAIHLAVEAGVDILTFSNNISGSKDHTASKVHAIIRGFVEEGVIASARIDESFARIMRLKKRLLVGMSADEGTSK